jgi:hypothetical protein
MEGLTNIDAVDAAAKDESMLQVITGCIWNGGEITIDLAAGVPESRSRSVNELVERDMRASELHGGLE